MSLKASVACVGMTRTVKPMVAKCPICPRNNPLNQRKPPLGVTKQKILPEIISKLSFLSYPDKIDIAVFVSADGQVF